MIRLHHVPSSRSFRVLWMLEELGHSAELVHYSIRDGGLHKPEYTALSPAGRVPALEIDGRVIFESGAIIEYLAETHPDSGLYRAPGHPDRVRYLEAIHFAETMAAQIEELNLNHVFLRPPAKPSVTVVKIITARLKATLRGMEAMLGSQDFVLPSGFSAADVMMGFNLMAAPYFVKLDPFPNLAAYRTRISERPAYKRAQQKDGTQDFYDRDFYPVPDA